MISFQEESGISILKEIQPLLMEHYAELSVHRSQGFALAPNYAAYKALDDNGVLVVTTMRQGGELVGYVSYILSPHLHYDGVVNADIDVFFLTKPLRKGFVGYQLLRESEKYARRRGATHIVQKSKISMDVSALFVRMGYTEIERVFIKELT